MLKQHYAVPVRPLNTAQTLFHYELASPYLLLWGVLWIVAGIISVISPENTGIGWLIVDTIGIVASGYLVASDARRFDNVNVRNEGLRYGATAIVLGAFITMTFVVFAPVSGVEVQTFITILGSGHLHDPGLMDRLQTCSHRCSSNSACRQRLFLYA